MNTRKQENKTAVYDRLNRAIKDLHHNATPDYPYDLMDQLDAIAGREGLAMDILHSEFGFEIDYINDGGACGNVHYGAFEHNKDKSPAYRKYLNNKYRKERAEMPEFQITDYGKIYQYGRGGRTLAPDSLIRHLGGSSFGLAQFDRSDDYPNLAEAVEMIRIIEAFNDYTARYCSEENLAYLIKDRIAEMESDLRQDVKDKRAAILDLVQDMKGRQDARPGPVCEVLREHLQSLLAQLREMQGRLRHA